MNGSTVSFGCVSKPLLVRKRYFTAYAVNGINDVSRNAKNNNTKLGKKKIRVNHNQGKSAYEYVESSSYTVEWPTPFNDPAVASDK